MFKVINELGKQVGGRALAGVEAAKKQAVSLATRTLQTYRVWSDDESAYVLRVDPTGGVHATDGPAVRKASGSLAPGNAKKRVFRFRDEEYEAWQDEAKRRGVSLTSWLREAANRYVGGA